MFFTAEQVIAACAPKHPAVIATRLPQYAAALAERHIDDPLCDAAFLATIAVETAHTFEPIHERWPVDQTPEQYFARYAPPHHVALVLGNRNVADAILYRGRGDIQLTGRGLYLSCGAALGLDLAGNPEQLLDPVKSARAAAWYFQLKGLDPLAKERNWPGVRRAVNGGLGDYEEFEAHVTALCAYLPATV